MADVRLNKWGYEVRTSSDECVSAINSYYDQVLGYGKKSRVILDAVAHDPRCVLGNALAAYYVMHADPSSLNRYAEAAESHLERASLYEKAVFDSIKCCILSSEMDSDDTFELHAKLLNAFPRDLSSLKRAQLLFFYAGRPDLSLKLAQQVVPYNREENYMYPMLSFPFLEAGEKVEGRNAALRGMEINQNDCWAHHALCHVLHHECQYKEAVNFMYTQSPSWDSCASFMYSHNWWHVCLCYLEGHAPLHRIFEIYDTHIWKPLITSKDAEYIQKAWNVEWLLDLMAVWAFSLFEEREKAELLLAGLKSRVCTMKEKQQQLMKKPVLLAEALCAYGRGDCEAALQYLGPDFNAYNLKMIGASNEQLDLFHEAWYDILLKSDKVERAVEVLEGDVRERDGVPYLWRVLEKAHAIAGNRERAIVAAAKARALENTYFDQ